MNKELVKIALRQKLQEAFELSKGPFPHTSKLRDIRKKSEREEAIKSGRMVLGGTAGMIGGAGYALAGGPSKFGGRMLQGTPLAAAAGTAAGWGYDKLRGGPAKRKALKNKILKLEKEQNSFRAKLKPLHDLENKWEDHFGSIDWGDTPNPKMGDFYKSTGYNKADIPKPLRDKFSKKLKDEIDYWKQYDERNKRWDEEAKAKRSK